MEARGCAGTEEDEEGSVRRDSGIDFSDDGGSANGGLLHDAGEEEEEDQKHSGDGVSTGDAGKKKNKRKGKGGKNKALEFKSGMIFNLEM